jgi:hypothetical protein
MSSSLKDIEQAQKTLRQQQQLIAELNTLVQDIDRSEKTIVELKDDLSTANGRYPNPRTTRQDVDYLTELLRCANKKLVWEKQLASLHKRTPPLLARMARLLDDPNTPPSEEVRAQVLTALKAVQAAMERLQGAKVD